MAPGDSSICYSGRGGAIICQDESAGHCDVWTSSGRRGVSHRIRVFVLKVCAPRLRLLIFALLLRREMRGIPFARSVTCRLIPDPVTFRDPAESTEILCVLQYVTGEKRKESQFDNEIQHKGRLCLLSFTRTGDLVTVRAKPRVRQSV